MKKKIFITLAAFALSFQGFAACGDNNGSSQQRIMQLLNSDSRSATAQQAYNNITKYYSEASHGSCDLSSVANKLQNVQQMLNSNLTNNFNGASQIPYNDRNQFAGKEVQYDVPTGKTGPDGKPIYEKKWTNTPVDGTDHLGLIKYAYAKAGVNTAGINEMSIDDFAKLTKYQYQKGSVLKPGDIIVMNYGNDSKIDTLGLVYWDANAGRLKMLEMGGSPGQGGSSVKSEIPVTGTASTAYVVPFETVMETAYSNASNDSDRNEEIRENMTEAGSNEMGIPASNPKNETLSQPRQAGVLTDNGFSDENNSNALGVEPEEISKQMNGATREMYETFSQGTAKVAPIVLTFMVLFFSIQMTWKIFKGGAFGDPAQIFHMVLGDLMLKSPYFIFVIFYPLIMRHLIIPLFMYKLPTYFFGDFIKVGHISMGHGKYLTYLDMMAHILKKGGQLVMKTFNLQQPDSVKSLFGMFGTIWKTLSPEAHAANWASGDWVALAGSLLDTYGVLTKIIFLIMQIILFRPISSLTGLLTLITLFNLALNMFMCALLFVLSTSVGLFYMICGTWDVLQAKAMNTFSIIILGLIQYMIMLAFVIVMAEACELLAAKLPGTIINPANFMYMIKVYICISIVNSMSKQVGMAIATSF